MSKGYIGLSYRLFFSHVTYLKVSVYIKWFTTGKIFHETWWQLFFGQRKAGVCAKHLHATFLTYFSKEEIQL